jgi:hypothetical protein
VCFAEQEACRPQLGLLAGLFGLGRRRPVVISRFVCNWFDMGSRESWKSAAGDNDESNDSNK